MEEIRNPQEVLALVVAKAMEAKWALCEDNGGIADAPPLLVGEFPNGDGFIAPDVMEGHPTDTLPMMLTGLGQAMIQEYGTPKFLWLAYVVEGYCQPKENLPEELHRGDLEQEYKNNPATEVREGIIATYYPWDGVPIVVTILYRYDDKGMPVFDEIDDQIVANAGGGVIPDIFRSFIDYCHKVVEVKNN